MTCVPQGNGPLLPSLSCTRLHLWAPAWTLIDPHTWPWKELFPVVVAGCPQTRGNIVFPSGMNRLDVDKQARYPPEHLSPPQGYGAAVASPERQLECSVSLPVTALSVTSGLGLGQAASKHFNSWKELAVVPTGTPAPDGGFRAELGVSPAGLPRLPFPKRSWLRLSPSASSPEILLFRGEDHLHPGPQHLRHGPAGGHRHPGGSQVRHLHHLFRNLCWLPVIPSPRPDSSPGDGRGSQISVSWPLLTPLL